jgi:hypothetical protein
MHTPRLIPIWLSVLLMVISVPFTFYDSYDRKPPAEAATGNDYGFTTGLSWSFRR